VLGGVELPVRLRVGVINAVALTLTVDEEVIVTVALNDKDGVQLTEAPLLSVAVGVAD